MPSLPTGDYFIAQEATSMPIADLAGAKIGVEATAYLQFFLEQPPAREPLLVALGGEPISLRHHIEEELNRWRAHDITPVFVFEGQSTIGRDAIAMRRAKAGLIKIQRAWNLYSDNRPTEAVDVFGSVGGIRANDFANVLREVLDDRGLEYIIAPFSACAQLAYLDTLESQYIDAIMGSQELLLYDVHDAVMLIPTTQDWERKSFSGVFKSELIKKLNVSSDMFVDAFLMTGTSFLPPFPPLEDPDIIRNQPYAIQDAINSLRTSEKSVTSTCTAFSDILAARDPDWLDSYRKAKMSVKHCVTADETGRIVVKDFENLTGDNHLYLGLQLPPELYYYLTTSIVGPRLMNTIQSLESLVFPTLDGLVSDEYRKLTTESLVSLKELAAGLLTSRIHRGFLYRPLNIRLWFDDRLKIPLNHRGVQPQTNQQLDTWAVRENDLRAQAGATGSVPGKLSFAAMALQDTNFSTQSKPGEVRGLSLGQELIPNALWRLLHLRGYINDEHRLTSWGQALATTYRALQPAIKRHRDLQKVEEAAFLAFELLRFDNLNNRNLHVDLVGGPLRGTEEDKANCMLICRTACLLKVRHKSIGYTGPLSKNFLHYYSITKAVRETDRDLLEAIVASMLLSGQGARDTKGFKKLGRSLPFGTDTNLAMGIAVKTYLDDYVKLDTSPAERAKAKSDYSSTFLPYATHFTEDLDVAFEFFDALHQGVQTLSATEMSAEDQQAWADAAAYLALRK